MNILVLDDDQAIHAYYRHILKQIKGVGVITIAHDDQSFSDALSKNRYRVILSDIHMEPKSGPNILRDHREEIAGMEIIMLSCADSLDEQAKALTKDGVNVKAYFQKPLVPQDLFDLLECN